MPHRYEEDWNELARREPYFAVLTDRRFLRSGFDLDARRQFFESGEADVERVFSAIRELTGDGFHPETALDFGCGVGRLTFALARRVARVAGIDASPEMIAIATSLSGAPAPSPAIFPGAAENAVGGGSAPLRPIRWETDLEPIAGEKFDFIISLIVFQHIPVREGLTLFSELLDLLATNGIAAIHFTLHRPGSPLRRLARRLRGAIPVVHKLALRLEGDDLGLPYMQMNEYPERKILGRVEKAGARVIGRIPRSEGGVEGTVFLVVKR